MLERPLLIQVQLILTFVIGLLRYICDTYKPKNTCDPYEYDRVIYWCEEIHCMCVIREYDSRICNDTLLSMNVINDDFLPIALFRIYILYFTTNTFRWSSRWDSTYIYMRCGLLSGTVCHHLMDDNTICNIIMFCLTTLYCHPNPKMSAFALCHRRCISVMSGIMIFVELVYTTDDDATIDGMSSTLHAVLWRHLLVVRTTNVLTNLLPYDSLCGICTRISGRILLMSIDYWPLYDSFFYYICDLVLSPQTGLAIYDLYWVLLECRNYAALVLCMDIAHMTRHLLDEFGTNVLCILTLPAWFDLMCARTATHWLHTYQLACVVMGIRTGETTPFVSTTGVHVLPMYLYARYWWSSLLCTTSPSTFEYYFCLSDSMSDTTDL